ncbi:MAG: O-antigen ligase family protein [Candidatus Omnitrophota bacterium]
MSIKKEKIIYFCDKFLYWLIIIMPFAGSFSSAFLNILIGFSIATYLLKKILLKQYSLPTTSINVPFCFLIIISLISFWNSLDLSASIQGIFKLFKYGFLFLIITETVNEASHLGKIILSLALGIFFVCLDAVFQLQFGRDFIRNHVYDFAIGLPRLRASFPHTNLFALYLGLTLPIVFCLSRFLKGKLNFFLTIVSILGLFCLFFTFSRGAIVGFLLAIILIAILKKDKLLLKAILVSIIIVPFLVPGSIKDWVKERSSILEVFLNAERIYIYKTTFNMISQHPLIGVGVNTFSQNYRHYKVSQSYGNTGESNYYGHNNFLHMAGEIGLIGFGIFLWLLFNLFKNWVITYRQLPDNSILKVYSLGLIAGIICFLVNGLTETGLYYSKIATWFWLEIGLILSVYKLVTNFSKRGG